MRYRKNGSILPEADYVKTVQRKLYEFGDR